MKIGGVLIEKVVIEKWYEWSIGGILVSFKEVV